jgi:putative ABC transport system permease protein
MTLVAMLRNYLLLTFRDLARHKVYASINVLGLAIGLAAFTLITAYVKDERSFDTFPPHHERIYRVVGDLKLEGQGERSSSCVFGLGPHLMADHPELIETYARFFDMQEPSIALRVDDKRYNEQDVYFADSTVFGLFGYGLLEGDPHKALREPNSIVLTADMARRYFGDADPMGRIIRWDKDHDLLVTGVLAPVPRNSHIRFDALISIYSVIQIWQGIEQHNWVWNPCWTYVRLKGSATPDELQRTFPDFIHKYYPDFLKEQVHHNLQPLASIHLDSDLDYEMAPNGQRSTVGILWAIGIFILLIACVNYMNLATAQSASRAREVGVRKTAGAFRAQLVAQFLTGSVVVALLAAMLAVALIALALPWFNSIADKQLTIDGALLLRLLLFAVFAGILAGLYPAFFLSSFRPAWVMKGHSAGAMQGRLLRKGLVVGQFAVALALIIGTVFVRRQFNALRSADLGFRPENVVVIRTRASMSDFIYPLIPEMRNVSGVKAIGFANDIIGKAHNAHELNYEGMPKGQWKYFPALITGFGMRDVLDLKMVAGRWYDPKVPREDSLSVVINEQMVKELGWSSPEAALGQRLNTPSGSEHVIGVVKDFHFDPLFKPIGPFFFDMCPADQLPLWFRCVYVRIAGDPRPAIAAIRKKWEAATQEFPFEYGFLDNELEAQYRPQGTLATLVTGFAVLAMIIACMGLYALAAFSTERRTREIGIRNVLGARPFAITRLVTREFLLLVVIANLFAWPLAWFGVDRWLEGFAVRTAIDPLVFLLAAMLVFMIAVATVLYRALRAARLDPVRALRHD